MSDGYSVPTKASSVKFSQPHPDLLNAHRPLLETERQKIHSRDRAVALNCLFANWTAVLKLEEWSKC